MTGSHDMVMTAAVLLATLGLAHSVLGERYILIRLFRRALPRLFGSDEFTRGTLRFAWHLTTVLFWCLAALLCQLSTEAAAEGAVKTIGAFLLASASLPLLLTRGRHLSWIVLSAAGELCLF